MDAALSKLKPIASGTFPRNQIGYIGDEAVTTLRPISRAHRMKKMRQRQSLGATKN